MADHVDEKLFKCETCGICFAQKNTLEEHVNSHLCQKPFKCNQCDKAFTKKFHLSIHIKSVHKCENTKSYECLLCPEVFPSKYYLKVHMTEHDTKNLFKCEICGKSFVLKSTLNEHMKTTHLGQKRFKCDQCNKTFTRKYYLSVHIKSGHKHNSCVLQKCHICKKEFKNKTHLKLHIKEHAKPECSLCFQPTEECACSWNSVDDKCDRLRNRFARENLMIRCQTCSKPILRNSQLKMHLRIHRDYKCILCNEDYKSCSCCDDYMEVSKTTNTYQKTSKPSTSADGPLTGKTAEPAVINESAITDEKESIELSETIITKDDKCIHCNEDYKNCSCSGDYMEVTKSINTYQKIGNRSIYAKKPLTEKSIENFTPINESVVKDEKKSIELSEMVKLDDDKCKSCNENNYTSCSCSDDYMEVTKSVKTYQKSSKSYVKVKEEEIIVPVVKFEEKPPIELSEIIVPKDEPKEEFEIGENSVEAFAYPTTKVDEDIKAFNVKEESIEL